MEVRLTVIETTYVPPNKQTKQPSRAGVVLSNNLMGDNRIRIETTTTVLGYIPLVGDSVLVDIIFHVKLTNQERKG